MEILIDDTSPQITYGPRANGWITDHPEDPLTPQYFGGTFHATFTDGDYMLISFNGTGIRVYGAKRDNHGTYSVKLDDGTPQLLAGLGDSALQALLYQVGGLSDTKQHELVLTNLPMQIRPASSPPLIWLDIDFVVIEQAMPDKIYTTPFDDTSDAISYSAWWRTPTPPRTVRDQYYQGTVHQSSSPGNSLTFPFNGTSLQVFGSTSKNAGRYSVQLDDTSVQVLNATSEVAQANATLFWASGLKDGPHLLSITNVGGADAKAANLEIDYIVVNSTTDPRAPPIPTTTGTASKTSTSTSTGVITRTVTTTSSKAGSSSGTTVPASGEGGEEKSVSTSAGAIAGGVLGALAGLVLLGLLACFCLRRKRREREAYEEKRHMDLIATPVISAFPDEPSPARYDPPSARSGDHWPPTAGSLQSGGMTGGESRSPGVPTPIPPQPYGSSPSPTGSSSASPMPPGYVSWRGDEFHSNRGVAYPEEAVPPPLLSPLDLGMRATRPVPPRLPPTSFQPWASPGLDEASRQSQQLPMYAEADGSPLYGGVVFTPSRVPEKQPLSAPVAITPSRLSPSGDDAHGSRSANSGRIPVPPLTRENSTSLPYAACPAPINLSDPPRSR